MLECYVLANKGGYCYVLNGDIRYGSFDGTTEDQMYLMSILRVLHDNDIDEDIIFKIPHERTYKRMIGEYEVKGILADYMDEIGWSIGNFEVSYELIDIEEISNKSFYKGLKKVMRGEEMLFDIDGDDVSHFEVDDVFNDNRLEGYLYRKSGSKYGMLYIEYVNGEYCPQWIWATPKLQYPFDREGNYYNIDFDEILMYEKKDGTNILCFRYEDIEGNKYVSYKTRMTPIIQNGKWGRFQEMWSEILERYPDIPDFCLDNEVNASFEMFGSRNPILIKYDIRLDAEFLFARDDFGNIIPPTEFDLDKYSFDSVELYKKIDEGNFEEEYKRAVEELNEKLEVVENPDGNDIVDGWEGVVCYTTKNGKIPPYKCKPDYVRDLHFFAASGIPKHSIYITCKNVFESVEDPELEDVIDLLKEEFDESDIYRKIETVKRIFKDVYKRMKMRKELIEEYEKHDFDIVENRGQVMRYFDKLYSKDEMSEVFNILWEEYGK